LITNNILAGILIPTFANVFGVAVDDATLVNTVTLGIYLFMIGITIPIQLLKTTGPLSKLGAFTILTLAYTTFVIIYQCPEYVSQNKPEISLARFDMPILMLENVGVYFFTNYVLDGIFLTKSTMGKVTEKRIMAFGTAGTMCLSLPYLVISVVAYISVGSKAIDFDLIINRPALAGSQDIMMTVAKVMVSGIVLTGYLGRFIAMKAQFFSTLNKKITVKANYIYTFTVLLIPAFIAFVYPSVSDWIGLVGAFCMTTLTCTLPALMTVTVMKKKGKSGMKMYLIGAWGLFFTIIGYTSGVAVLLKMLHVIG